MEEPLVSIITPVYDSEKFINDTIRSVLNQSYKNWEYILVDDCSSDNSWEIINSFSQQDNRIKAYRLDINSGSGAARNHAIKNASGKYIAFLDSDDIWIPERLEKHISFMIKGNYAFSHSSYGYIDEKGIVMPKVYHVSKQPVGYKFLLRKTDIGCLTAIYDQAQIGKIYMPVLRRKQDYGLWLSILKNGVKSVPFPEVLAYYRQRKGSATSNKARLILQHYRFLRRQEKLSIVSSFKYTLLWGLGGIVKYYL